MTGKMSAFQKILKHKYPCFMISPRNKLDDATVSVPRKIWTEGSSWVCHQIVLWNAVRRWKVSLGFLKWDGLFGRRRRVILSHFRLMQVIDIDCWSLQDKLWGGVWHVGCLSEILPGKAVWLCSFSECILLISSVLPVCSCFWVPLFSKSWLLRFLAVTQFERNDCYRESLAFTFSVHRYFSFPVIPTPFLWDDLSPLCHRLLTCWRGPCYIESQKLFRFSTIWNALQNRLFPHDPQEKTARVCLCCSWSHPPLQN